MKGRGRKIEEGGGALPDEEESGEECDGGEVEDGGEDGLHGGDDEASVDDELRESRRSLVAVATVYHQQPTQVTELCDGEVCRQ